MKVTRMKTFMYRAAWTWLFLKLETDEGVSGWGEATTQSAASKATEAALHEFERIILLEKTHGRSNYTSAPCCAIATGDRL